MASPLAIPATAAVVIGITESADVINGDGFQVQPVIGGFVMGVFLYAINEVDSRLGSIFAVLIVIATVILHGQPLLQRLSQSTKQPATSKKGKRK